MAASPVIPSSLYIALLDTKKLCTSVLLRWIADEKFSDHSFTPESGEKAASNFAPVCSADLPTSKTADPNCFASSTPFLKISIAADTAKNDFTAEPIASLIAVPAPEPSLPILSRSVPVLSASSPMSSMCSLARSSASESFDRIVWIGWVNASLTSRAPSTASLVNLAAFFPAYP